jgi:hypothetical protein
MDNSPAAYMPSSLFDGLIGLGGNPEAYRIEAYRPCRSSVRRPGACPEFDAVVPSVSARRISI